MSTRTFAKLPVSKAVYDEVARKLLEADYGHTIKNSGVIDMDGIGLVVEPGKAKRGWRRLLAFVR